MFFDELLYDRWFNETSWYRKWTHRLAEEVKILREEANIKTQFQDAVEEYFRSRSNWTRDDLLRRLPDEPTWSLSWFFIIFKCLSLAQRMEVGTLWNLTRSKYSRDFHGVCLFNYYAKARYVLLSRTKGWSVFQNDFEFHSIASKSQGLMGSRGLIWVCMSF